MQKRLFLLGITTLVMSLMACTRTFNPEVSCNFVQNSDLQRVSWNKSLPVKLYVHESMDRHPEMEAVIRSAVESWNTVAGREVFRLQAFHVGGDPVPRKDGYSMLYWMENWGDKNNLEQARTTIYWSGAQIYEADIRFNAKDHNFYVGLDDVESGVDFKSLLVHELGHALGLAHNAASTSVMNVTLNEATDRRTIEKIDTESLLCEYGT